MNFKSVLLCTLLQQLKQMTILFALLTLLYIKGLYCTILCTSMNPIILKLQRFSNDNKTLTIKDSKTKALFFSRVLELQPGMPFELNIDKWIALQRSGLFSNLTAKSVVTKDGVNNSDGVALEISGIENPSTSFAPEIGVSLSLTTPEVCGGVIMIITIHNNLFSSHIDYNLFQRLYIEIEISGQWAKNWKYYFKKLKEARKVNCLFLCQQQIYFK